MCLDKIPFVASSCDDFFIFQFRYNGNVVKDAPQCLFSLRHAGDMQFNWDNENPNRAAVFARAGINPHRVAAIKLIHSHIVYNVSPRNALDMQSFLAGCEGDGIITQNSDVVPSVTGADCMPIYLYDTVTGARGVVHSGWKGTGIAATAVAEMTRYYGTRPEHVCAVLGPHIRECCYTVDAQRAELFSARYGSDCVIPHRENEQTVYYLSLLKANGAVLHNAGVTAVAYTDVCTCCNTAFGSFRREAAAFGAGTFTRGAACVF